MLTEPCRGFVTRIECFLGCRPCSAVHARTDVQCKAEAIAALPDFVKRSSRMLILWDETYFERLWCNVEIVGRSVAEKSTWPNDPVHLTQPKQLTDEAVFLKSHPDPSAIRMIPLWLSPWLLCSLLLEWVCARYTVPLMFMLLAEWSWVSGAPPQSRLDWVLRNVIFCLTSTVAHLPSALLATLSFTLKLRQHGRLLDQLRDFDVRSSKCTVESDRPMLEAEIASLHKEQKMSVEDVPLLFRSSGMDVHQEECLDLFSAYVRGQLHDQIVEELGNRTELPFGLCVLVYMPMHFFNYAESFLACEGYGCESALQYFGYQSVQQLFIFDAVIYFIMMVTTLPMTFPCLLKMLDLSYLIPGGAVVQVFFALASGLFSYAYAFCMGGLVGGCLIGFMVKGLSACWLAFFVGILGFLLVQCLTVFCAKSTWSSCNAGQLGCRCLGRTF